MDRVELAFRKFDLNHDGYLSRDEFDQVSTKRYYTLYSARNLEMSIRFSLKSRPSERFHRSKMSHIKAEISLHTNVKLNFHKNVGCQ